MNYRVWFGQIWPFPQRRAEVLRGYRVLGSSCRATLADIALRNHVFGEAPPAADLFNAGVAEGRRRAALEVFKLCNINHEQLWELIEKKPEAKS